MLFSNKWLYLSGFDVYYVDENDNIQLINVDIISLISTDLKQNAHANDEFKAWIANTINKRRRLANKNKGNTLKQTSFSVTNSQFLTFSNTIIVFYRKNKSLHTH